MHRVEVQKGCIIFACQCQPQKKAFIDKHDKCLQFMKGQPAAPEMGRHLQLLWSQLAQLVSLLGRTTTLGGKRKGISILLQLTPVICKCMQMPALATGHTMANVSNSPNPQNPLQCYVGFKSVCVPPTLQWLTPPSLGPLPSINGAVSV